MMAVDLSIYNALLQPGPSALQVSNALADRRMREEDQTTQRQLNALQLQKTQFDMEGARKSRDEENALRTYLGGNPDLTTSEGQMGLYRVAPKAAGGILKERATAAAQDATRLNQQRETQIKTLQFLGQVAGGVTDQASYDAALATIKQAGIDPAAIGAPPQYNPQVVANFGRQALTRAQQLEQEWKAKEFGLKAGNELIGPDGKVNQTLVGLKQGIAKAGAANVSVNTGQKGLDNEFKLRGEFKSEPVYKAHQEMQSAYGQIKQSISQASPAGDLAAATKIMKLLDPGSVVRESELGMAMQATGLMDRLTNYGNMIVTGQKLTPKQRGEFQALADSLYGESVKQYNAKRSEYRGTAERNQLNEQDVLGAESVGPSAAGGGWSIKPKGP